MKIYQNVSLYCALFSALFSPYLLANDTSDARSLSQPRAIAQQSRPSITLYPQRIYLTDANPTGAVTILNSGNGIGTYEIDLIDFVVTDEGGYAKPETSLPTSAKPYLRYSPKKGRLKPGQSRRILLKKKVPSSVGSGEFRSHLRILSAAAKAPSTSRDQLAPKKIIAVSTKIRQGISIPIIVRTGRVDAIGTFESSVLRFDEKGRLWLHLSVLREGSRSLYGNIEVMEEDIRVGIANKVSVYAPNSLRHVKILLDDHTYTSTKPLNIRYVSEDPEDKGDLIANTTLLR